MKIEIPPTQFTEDIADHSQRDGSPSSEEGLDTPQQGEKALVQETGVKRKRNLPGTPDPDAEVIALSPKTLLATNRFVCEICNKGFQRDQNLQLHRRGHNLPWKLRQRTSKEIRKKVYICPEPACIHHDPARALGDLTGIKKHFCRKHGEKKYKCEKCSKRYAVQSDWKAHLKTCGTREYRCDCGTLFSRRDSFITHRAFCDALAETGGSSLKNEPQDYIGGEPSSSGGSQGTNHSHALLLEAANLDKANFGQGGNQGSLSLMPPPKWNNSQGNQQQQINRQGSGLGLWLGQGPESSNQGQGQGPLSLTAQQILQSAGQSGLLNGNRGLSSVLDSAGYGGNGINPSLFMQQKNLQNIGSANQLLSSLDLVNNSMMQNPGQPSSTSSLLASLFNNSTIQGMSNNSGNSVSGIGGSGNVGQQSGLENANQIQGQNSHNGAGNSLLSELVLAGGMGYDQTSSGGNISSSILQRAAESIMANQGGGGLSNLTSLFGQNQQHNQGSSGQQPNLLLQRMSQKWQGGGTIQNVNNLSPGNNSNNSMNLNSSNAALLRSLGLYQEVGHSALNALSALFPQTSQPSSGGGGGGIGQFEPQQPSGMANPPFGGSNSGGMNSGLGMNTDMVGGFPAIQSQPEATVSQHGQNMGAGQHGGSGGGGYLGGGIHSGGLGGGGGMGVGGQGGSMAGNSGSIQNFHEIFMSANQGALNQNMQGLLTQATAQGLLQGTSLQNLGHGGQDSASMQNLQALARGQSGGPEMKGLGTVTRDFLGLARTMSPRDLNNFRDLAAFSASVDGQLNAAGGSPAVQSGGGQMQ